MHTPTIRQSPSNVADAAVTKVTSGRVSQNRRMKKITQCLAVALLVCAARGEAGEAPRTWKIAVLLAQSGPSEDQTTRGLRDGLKDLGYAERKNVVIEIDDLKGKTAALDT